MSLGARLLSWYRTHKRDLPWRDTRDPYRILVSELMLQQTQVDRVRLFYVSWLKQFPDWNTLAKASNGKVIRAWAGLGYNRRVLMLRDIARTVVKNGLPKTAKEWEQLKGIGPYTAAAVSLFASHERVLPIDTNIRRVLARLLLAIPFPDASVDPNLHSQQDKILPKRGHFFDVPQALFDLATSVCKKDPDCATCPMRCLCPMAEAFMTGRVTIPKRSTKKPRERIHRNKRYPDRIFRGRILRVVREHSGVSLRRLGPLVDPTFDQEMDVNWLHALVARLKADGMLTQRRGNLYLVD